MVNLKGCFQILAFLYIFVNFDVFGRFYKSSNCIATLILKGSATLCFQLALFYCYSRFDDWLDCVLAAAVCSLRPNRRPRRQLWDMRGLYPCTLLPERWCMWQNRASWLTGTPWTQPGRRCLIMPPPRYTTWLLPDPGVLVDSIHRKSGVSGW